METKSFTLLEHHTKTGCDKTQGLSNRYLPPLNDVLPDYAPLYNSRRLFTPGKTEAEVKKKRRRNFISLSFCVNGP